ncbi:MAG TPA: NifU N-terminal domain-containing protein [Acidimicrobiia bacterium]|nr:NifU N-terminal domain-containing protein [Acidimicrobiia bacterium]
MTELGPELDAARAQVVQRELVPDAIAALTPVVSDLPLDALGPVKQLLKRFFSDAAWTAADADALADVVGAGSGGGRHELGSGLTLVWSWDHDRFRLGIESDEAAAPAPGGDAPARPGLGQTFDGAVVPEATPSPRTIRFATPPLHAGTAPNYESGAAATADPRVAALFDAFGAVTNVLLGPDFVAVTITRPDGWEELLEPILRAVTAEFTGGASSDAGPGPSAPDPARAVPADASEARAPRRIEQAWTDLGGLRADRPDDLDRILAATEHEDAAHRQVAAALLADAPSDAAAGAWARLLDDPSRAVRRSVVDAVAGAEREELRPLLERALDDPDAWIRWKALSGMAALGVGASRAAVAARAEDPDFRVRLEAARLLDR